MIHALCPRLGLAARQAVPAKVRNRLSSLPVISRPLLRSSWLHPTDVQHLIAQGLPGAEISVTSEDGTHFEARIVSELFAGKRPLARHQLVYAALGVRMGREIHALSMRNLTPDEARK